MEEAEPASKRRPTTMERTPSTNSVSKASPSAKSKLGSKQFAVGQSKRNSSYGANLNKLQKQPTLHWAEDTPAGRHMKTKSRDSSSPPAGGHVKKDGSTVSLPRVGSKSSIKKNHSTTSLKKNTSSTQVHRAGRPQVPLRRSTSGKDKDKEKAVQQRAKGHAPAFSIGSMDRDGDIEEDEWTEDTNSQSPGTTRNSSAAHSRKMTPAANNLLFPKLHQLASPPESSALRGSWKDDSVAPTLVQSQPSGPKSFRPPDGDDPSKRLLIRRSQQRDERRTNDVQDAQTPPTLGVAPSSQEPSLPSNGRSHFLPTSKTPSSSGGALSGALSGATISVLRDTPHTPPTPLTREHSRSLSPDAGEQVRRARSTGHFSTSTAKPKTSDVDEVIDLPKGRPSTKLKLDLWRSQTHVELSQGPPAPLLERAGPQQSYLNLGLSSVTREDNRWRSWENAGRELKFLRLYRNPVNEGVHRVKEHIKDAGLSVDMKTGRSSMESTRGRRPASERSRTTVGTTIETQSALSVSLGTADRKGALGTDTLSDGQRDPSTDGEEHEDQLEMLLRRMWDGGDIDMVDA